MATTLQTTVARLRSASLPEIVYRLRRVFFIRLLKLIFISKCYPRVPEVDLTLLENLHLPDIKGRSLGSAATAPATLGADLGKIRAFEARYRNTFFARVPHGEVDLDIRAVWEVARLQHLWPALADERFFAGQSRSRLRSGSSCTEAVQWVKDNSFLSGPHYESSMECGLRIPLFLFCLKSASLATADFLPLIRAVYHHGWLIYRRLALYSSRGNHTVAEAMGLVFAGAVFQQCQEGKCWLQRGFELLLQEAPHQILGDGGPAEQSITYHRFVLDMYWLVLDFAAKNHLGDLAAIRSQLVRGEEFWQHFSAGGKALFRIGDSDDGEVFAPGLFPVRDVPVPAKKTSYSYFPQAGYSVFHLAQQRRIVFDHGSLGLAPLHNHGHADALALLLAVGDTEILVDSGSYVYNGRPDWRAYFKGTSAHNTITIDGEDQAVQLTGFVWTKPFQTKMIAARVTSLGYLLVAEHSGYLRLRNPVRHRRALLTSDAVVLVRDSFSGLGQHDFQLNFHFHPECCFHCSGNRWNISRKNVCMVMQLVGSADSLIQTQGQSLPIKGWYSSRYGKKQPCSVLSCVKNGAAAEVSFITAIIFDESVVVADLLEQLDWQ